MGIQRVEPQAPGGASLTIPPHQRPHTRSARGISSDEEADQEVGDDESVSLLDKTSTELYHEQLESYKTETKVFGLREEIEDEALVHEQLATWEAVRGRSTVRKEWRMGVRHPLPYALLFLLLLGGLLYTQEKTSPLFILVCAFLLVALCLLPIPTVVGVPDLQEEMLKRAKEAVMDPELYAYLTYRMAFEPRTKVFTKNVRHTAEVWIKSNRKNWNTFKRADQVMKAAIFISGPGLTEEIAFRHWSDRKTNLGMWKVSDWSTSGKLLGGALMPPV